MEKAQVMGVQHVCATGIWILCCAN